MRLDFAWLGCGIGCGSPPRSSGHLWIAMTENERDRLRREREQINAELASEVAEMRPKLERLAERMEERGDTDGAAKLREMMEQLVEMARRRQKDEPQ